MSGAPSRSCICSTISRSYAPFASVFARSIRDHHPEVDVLICVVDGTTADAPAGTIGVCTSDLVGPQGMEDILYRYRRQALVVSTKAAMLRHCLDRGYERAVFLDVDVLVLDRIDALLDPGRPPILLTPHFLEPLQQPLGGVPAAGRELSILWHGVVNGGCISVGRSPEAMAFLEWFAARLRHRCILDREGGLHYDQTWLDLALTMFDDVALERDPGCNVAYWNLPERPVERAGDRWTTLGRPVRFFHFSGFDPCNPDRPSRYLPHLRMEDVGGAAALFRRYGELLDAAGVQESLRIPRGLTTFADGTQVPGLLADRITHGQLAPRGINPSVATRDDVRVAFGTTAERVSPIWLMVWEDRPDLRDAFHEPDGADRVRFESWIRHSGPTEFPELWELLEA